MYLVIRKNGTFARERIISLTSIFRFDNDTIKVYSRTLFLDGGTYPELVRHSRVKKV